MKHLFLMWILIPITAVRLFAQENSTGLLFDDESYESDFRMARGLDFTDLDTSNIVSLKNYAPEPGKQGKSPSCVPWASGYAALTISYRVAGQTIAPRSPIFLFNQAAGGKNCKTIPGTKINDVLKLLQIKGDCALDEFHPPVCDSLPPGNISLAAETFKIKDYYTLFGTNDAPGLKIKNTIVSISSNKPVIIGMEIYKNMDNVNDAGIYVPDTLSGGKIGHAMCVVGFDKTKKQFEILNSWGTDWGNKGYFNISFDDFARYTKYGYCINAETNRGLNFTDSKVELAGEFLFKKLIRSNTEDIKFEEVNVALNNGMYSMKGNGKVDDFYKLVAQNAKENTFLYIFTLKPDLTSELLFPRSDKGKPSKDAPVITSRKVKVVFPENPNNAFKTDQAGVDYLCILYSYKRIDNINALVKQIESFSGSFTDRFQSVFGSMLIPFEEITYAKDQMKVNVTSENGYIAPIILRVDVTN